jgi:hypothetical protein
MFEGPSAEDLGFELIPAADAGLTAQEELDAAVAEALAPDYTPLEGGEAIPLGKSPVFDYEARRFVRRGAAPVWVSGTRALQQWCEAVLHSARFAHAIFDDEQGVEDLESEIGVLPAVNSDFAERVTRALMQHDRIAAVEDVQLDRDPLTGDVTIQNLTIVLDDDDRLLLGTETETTFDA